MKCTRPVMPAKEVHLKLPPGKSQANRYLILNYLSGGPLPSAQELPSSDDVQRLRQALCSHCGVLDVGMAGTASRFLLATMAFTPGERVIDGAPRLRERPLRPLVDALRSLGADIKVLTDKSLPIYVKGVVPSISEVSIEGDISSQFISALLMVGTRFPNGLRIQIKGNQVSSSYVTLTIEAINQFGGKVHLSAEGFHVLPGLTTKTVFPSIEPDWSSVGPWFMCAALSGSSFFFPRLPYPSHQPDAKLFEWAKEFGLDFYRADNGLWIKPGLTNNKPLDFNLIDAPDLAPYLVLLAGAQNRAFRFTGLQTLTGKESDRIAALLQLLRRFGIEAQYDGIVLEKMGGQFTNPSKTPLPVFNDHRMAMALAPLAFLTEEICIETPEVVGKSYPDFWEHLAMTGMRVGLES